MQPVLEGTKLIGIVSIGDLLKFIISKACALVRAAIFFAASTATVSSSSKLAI
jgi:CBS domain-containing protein